MAAYASPESLSLFMYPEAEGGQAALFRRHPAQRRRLSDLPRRLSRVRTEATASAIRSGTSIPAPERPGVSNEFFNMLYQVLLGEDRGPRFGSFVALYGVEETRALIADALAGKFVTAESAPD
jgi:lysyl-tRNA synthetase class I